MESVVNLERSTLVNLLDILTRSRETVLFAIGQRPDTEPKGTFGNQLELSLRFEVEQALQRQTEELTHICTGHRLGLPD